jgi:hypothetical protein
MHLLSKYTVLAFIFPLSLICSSYETNEKILILKPLSTYFVSYDYIRAEFNNVLLNTRPSILKVSIFNYSNSFDSFLNLISNFTKLVKGSKYSKPVHLMVKKLKFYLSVIHKNIFYEE